MTQLPTLPDLPRQLIKREANITPKILDWFHVHYPHNVALEIKATKTNSIPKSAVKDHQLIALIMAQTKTGLTYKIPDNGRVRQPFDAFQFKNAHSFVVCAFLKQRIALAIDPNKWNGATPKSDHIFSIPL